MNQMRSSQKNRNGRHKSRGNKPSGNILNRVYESAGPEGKVRGTAQQIIDKYLVLARDAQTSGDRVIAENFLQHAEHYIRLVNAAMPPQTEDRRFQGYGGGRDDVDDGGDEGDDQPSQQPGHQPSVRNGHGAGHHDDPRDGTAQRAAEPSRRSAAAGGGALETIDTAEDRDADPVPTPEASATMPQAKEPAAAKAEPAAQSPEGADGPAVTADAKRADVPASDAPASDAQAADAPVADAQAADPAADTKAADAQTGATEGEAEAKPKPRRRTRRPKVTDEAQAG